MSPKKPKRPSLLDDESLEFVEDDGDTAGSGDICDRCGNQRAKHDEDSGECPDRKGEFRERA
jgi:hypothetical protein